MRASGPKPPDLSAAKLVHGPPGKSRYLGECRPSDSRRFRHSIQAIGRQTIAYRANYVRSALRRGTDCRDTVHCDATSCAARRMKAS